jgi:hypothetical protein
MSKFPFIGASYEARSKTFDSQRCVNLYPEASESGPGPSKGPAALIGTPGLALWSTLAGGGVRGLLRFSASLAIAVVGSNVYTVTTAGVGTLIGTVAGGSGPVSMASNGTVVMLVTGSSGYVVTPSASTVTAITDSDFTGADVVYFLDGYFVFNKPGTGQFQITQLYGTAIDGLDFATAEGSPDLLVSLIVDHRELWLLGENSVEIYFNSGNNDFPFERVNGAFIEMGCAAKSSAAKLDNSVFWLTADDRGQGIVVRAVGYQPQRVSTHAIEFAIARYSRIDDAVAYTYQQEGHSFYVLTFPTANATWVYDASTNLWHERAWRDPADGTLGRHRSQVHMAFADSNIVGDWETGKLYRLDLDTFTDDGSPIARIRSCPHLSSDLKWQFFTALQIDMETGVGLDSGQGSDPQAMLQYSDDGGFTWSNEVWAPMGKLGERKRRVRWRRLGKSRDRVFKVTITDPVKVVIVGASIQVTVGAS